jgi:hypothetical protein
MKVLQDASQANNCPQGRLEEVNNSEISNQHVN